MVVDDDEDVDGGARKRDDAAVFAVSRDEVVDAVVVVVHFVFGRQRAEVSYHRRHLNGC